MKRILIHSLIFSPDGVSTAYLYNAADPQNDDSDLSGDMLTDCVYDYAEILTADQKSMLEKTAKTALELTGSTAWTPLHRQKKKGSL